jgi:hypothetical protein
LFLLYIDDISDLLTGAIEIKMFADDIKIYLEIGDDSELSSFQNSINQITDWASIWQLKLFVDKFQHVRPGSDSLGENCRSLSLSLTS